MGWLAKKVLQTSAAPLYTTGQHKTVVIAGLGNPGKMYAATRHNLGFECLDHLARALNFPAWRLKKDIKCRLSQQVVGGKRIILTKPTTFMNNSGQALHALMQYFEVSPVDLVVIHDELDLPFGQIRTRVGGGSAGHNGLKSLIEHLGEGFGRVRIGIGPKPPRVDSADFVLHKFKTDEAKHLPMLKREVTALLEEYIYSPALDTQTRYFII